MLVTTIIGHYYIGKEVPNFLCSKTWGIVSSLITMVIFFYTYTGILGKNVAFIDISSFFAITAFGEYVAYLFMINKTRCNTKAALATLVVIFVCFLLFTYYPPNIGIFKELHL